MDERAAKGDALRRAAEQDPFIVVAQNPPVYRDGDEFVVEGRNRGKAIPLPEGIIPEPDIEGKIKFFKDTD